jgi:hypothetical protein
MPEKTTHELARELLQLPDVPLAESVFGSSVDKNIGELRFFAVFDPSFQKISSVAEPVFVPQEPIATHGRWKEYHLEIFKDENEDECYLDPEIGKKRKMFLSPKPIRPIDPAKESAFLSRLRKDYAVAK